MILEGPSIEDQCHEATLSIAQIIAQIIKFNAIKHARKKSDKSIISTRHNSNQETSLPIYIGLMLHAQTRKRDLIEKFHSLGLSISYDRVLRLSSEMGNNVISLYRREGVVCPPQMRLGVFTTAAVDNIDHNPSSTTAKGSFHGTSISLIQHYDKSTDGTDRELTLITGKTTSKNLDYLPHYYTNVPEISINVKDVIVPKCNLQDIQTENVDSYMRQEYDWLENAADCIQQGNKEETQNISWSGFHANRQELHIEAMSKIALLPLFHECAHTVAMIKHSMDVIYNAISHLNPIQPTVPTFDQPLYALAKQIQWKWPETYGEDKSFVMMGGLHIEMALQKTIGDWLQGSGWEKAITQSGISTAGTAESYIKATHLSRTRRSHQVTAAAIFIAQKKAYVVFQDKGGTDSFNDWCQKRMESAPQFKFWATVLELETLLNILVRSMRESNYHMYLDALTAISPWFFALDHTNYARWLPVHIRDLNALPERHPYIYQKFLNGHFTVRKSMRSFSSIPIDQAHEQSNALIKGLGGAVGLTEDPSALRRWMVSGPEVARVVQEFESNLNNKRCTKDSSLHHDQTKSVDDAFIEDVSSLLNTLCELGNPFEEESKDLLVLDSKLIAGMESVDATYKANNIGREQFKTFMNDRLLKCATSLYAPLTRNKLELFVAKAPKHDKKTQQIKSLKSDVGLFSRMYISSQTREGNLDDFFRHENQRCPPSLADSAGDLRSGDKSDLLACIEGTYQFDISEPPDINVAILDGAAIVQMLQPGTVRNFDEYAQQVFLPYIQSKIENVSRLDLIWDRYFSNSLKGTERAKRGKGIRRRVLGSTLIPTNWKDFLRVNENKIELFNLLNDKILNSDIISGKEFFVTQDERVLSKPLQNTQSLAPCTHEEADSRMLLHATHAASCGYTKILIRTVDTDVVVLSIMTVQKVPNIHELWLSFGSGKSFRYIPAHKINLAMGPERSLALPLFHAFTGCDTVSSFAFHGKHTAWAVWQCYPELTSALLHLSEMPDSISCSNLMDILQRFVILMYDRTSQCKDINKARMKIFAKNNNVERIPPTFAALEQHVRRALYQGSFIWYQSLLADPQLPSPLEWGWIQTQNSYYYPLWTLLPEAAKACKELISCGCHKGCKKGCKCKKAALGCTQLCVCEGKCVETI